MITDTIGIMHTGLRYEGTLIDIEHNRGNVFKCSYRWLYGITTVFIVDDRPVMENYKV